MDIKFIKEIEKSNHFKKEDWNNFIKVFKILNNRYRFKNINSPSIKNFHLYKEKLNPILIKSWELKKELNKFNLCLIKYNYKFEVVQNPLGTSSIKTDSSKYFFGYLTTLKDYGITSIRKETLIDKISELFNPIEIDFSKHKKFSNKYYVLSENPESFRKAINTELLDFLSKTKNIEIEFNNKSCLFRLPKAIELKESINLCEIGLKLNKILNK